MGRAAVDRPSRLVRVAPWSLALLFGALVTTWALTNPLGGAPDEPAHLMRAASLVRGDVVGDPLPDRPAAPAQKTCCRLGNPTSAAWVGAGIRTVMIPERFAPAAWPCRVTVLDRGAPCLPAGAAPRHPLGAAATTMGTIEPLSYVPAGLASLLPVGPEATYRAARLAQGWTLLALLLGTLAALLRACRPDLVAGAFVALTPMTVFLMASVGPSGAEVVGALCVALLLVAWAQGSAPNRASYALTVTGVVVLCTSRSLGPIWCAGILALALLLRERPDPLPVDERRRVIGVVAAFCVASASTVLWEVVVQPSLDVDGQFFWSQLGPTVEDAPGILREVVGVFGDLSAPLPYPVPQIFLAILLMASIGALALGTGRQRLALVSTSVALGAGALLLSAAVLRQNGFGLQGRHVLPAFVVFALVSVSTLIRGVSRWGRPRLAVGLTAGAIMGAAVLQVIGLATNLRSYTHSDTGWISHAATLGFSRSMAAGGVALVALAIVASLLITAGAPRRSTED